ncbi:hypothetical protein EMEDMD4_730024 [Sinorhizobium medicae]|uniref:Uncharacterized protein n=1 Tax=Sinorhizobium medicae TaxID=110321 RepID=A0A508XA46_9HYPH|nr:hypothetical protein EMEDMD4_730024 [Sinorhizobium medicae]
MLFNIVNEQVSQEFAILDALAALSRNCDGDFGV